MTIEAAVYDRLTTFAGLTALISTRTYAQILPTTPTPPACTYTVISTSIIGGMGSDAAIERARIQVTAWAETYEDAKNVSQQIRAALQRYRGTHAGTEIKALFLDNESDGYEPDTGYYRVDHDFDIVYGV